MELRVYSAFSIKVKFQAFYILQILFFTQQRLNIILLTLELLLSIITSVNVYTFIKVMGFSKPMYFFHKK